MNQEDYIMHYGVLGMKWGQRKNNYPSRKREYVSKKRTIKDAYRKTKQQASGNQRFNKIKEARKLKKQDLQKLYKEYSDVVTADYWRNVKIGGVIGGGLAIVAGMGLAYATNPVATVSAAPIVSRVAATSYREAREKLPEIYEKLKSTGMFK